MASAPAGLGMVDAASLDTERRELTVLGWMGSEQPQVFVTVLRVVLGERIIYRGRWQGAPRPDVVQATQRPDWLESGFRVVARIPWGMPSGTYPVRVFAHLGDGKEFELSHTEAARTVTIGDAAPWLLPAWAILALLALPAGLVLLHLALQQHALVRRWCSSGVFAGTVALAFCALVLTGTTGSSLPLLLKNAGPVIAEAPIWMGQARPVRSDEWEVVTPMALSQRAHQPPYPVQNQNLGTGGQNMLVVGMSGVPVAHISSLAKPATWGFFVLPLPQALAWYWWLPFFGCFGVLWLLLRRAAAMDWRAAAAWSAAVAYSPYSVAFSGWPAYLVFFGAAGALCSMHILQTAHKRSAALWGCCLGVAFTGYVLILYPAWQVSVAYLLAAYLVAWAWTNRHTLRWGAAQGLAVAAAVAVAALLLGAWWHDAAPAVHAIQATIYPGQRSTSVGGDIDPWYMIKGLLSPSTMYQTPALMDASDAGSIILLLIALLPCVALHWRQRKSVETTTLALVGYLVFLLCYLYIGLPEPLARISQWGRATSYRMDLALGLAQVLLLATLWRAAYVGSRWLGMAAAAFSLAAMALCYQALPAIIADALSPAFLWLSALAWAWAAYWLAAGRFAAATALLTAWTLAAAIPFHPMVRAPQPPVTAPSIAGHIAAGDRLAVIGQRRWSLLLPAAGVAVVNTVHYHPPQALWRQLDPEGRDATVHNRYQRLLLRLQSQPAHARPFALETPRLDEVVLSLDPARFPFETLQASLVLAPLDDMPALQANPGLTAVASGVDWVLMRVTPASSGF
ncbi:MAG TPA: hypothetical protein PK925_04055 [Alicycliphilus sp.]|nr:hypothetical protein [Alicycliphilus sp.]